MQLAREAGYEVVEDFLTPLDMYTSDEAFFTGTATEIIPIVSLDGTRIGCGKPGTVTQDIMARFKEHTTTGVPF